MYINFLRKLWGRLDGDAKYFVLLSDLNGHSHSNDDEGNRPKTKSQM